MLFEKTIVNAYRKALLKRHDPDGSIFYFAPESFPELKATSFDFKGERGQRLSGYFYETEVTHPGRVVIFEHGMGSGHRAYMKEILTIARAGYLVFAYDHTGTLASEGEHIGGFSQSLADLDHAMKALLTHPRCEGVTFSVIGHSWGGFSTMNIGAFYPEITHLVAMSGFISVNMILSSVLGKLSGFAPAIFATEAEYFGGYAFADARLSLIETRAKAMIIHSKDDPTVPYSHFELLREAVGESDRVKFVTLEGKYHNPNYTNNAVIKKDAFFAEHAAMTKKKKLATEEARNAFRDSRDWDEMTEQDGDVWQSIFDFLES